MMQEMASLSVLVFYFVVMLVAWMEALRENDRIMFGRAAYPMEFWLFRVLMIGGASLPWVAHTESVLFTMVMWVSGAALFASMFRMFSNKVRMAPWYSPDGFASSALIPYMVYVIAHRLRLKPSARIVGIIGFSVEMAITLIGITYTISAI